MHLSTWIPRGLGLTLAASLLVACGTSSTPDSTRPQAGGSTIQAASTGRSALQRLVEGNQRFVAMKLAHPDLSVERRVEVAKGQHPSAIILTCADSRVPPELVFDQGLGDLFVVRVAGNVLNDHVIGSIEYAAEHLHAPLVMVLGHERCGAVDAAIKGGEAPGKIGSLLEALQPAVQAAKGMPGDMLDNVVKLNAKRGSAHLNASEPILGHLVHSGELEIVGARYDLDTGKVEVL